MARGFRHPDKLKEKALEYRRVRKLSRAETCKLLGIHEATLRFWEDPKPRTNHRKENNGKPQI